MSIFLFLLLKLSFSESPMAVFTLVLIISFLKPIMHIFLKCKSTLWLGPHSYRIKSKSFSVGKKKILNDFAGSYLFSSFLPSELPILIFQISDWSQFSNSSAWCAIIPFSACRISEWSSRVKGHTLRVFSHCFCACLHYNTYYIALHQINYIMLHLFDCRFPVFYFLSQC